jgi:catechol 2,3-dioxygenase-like lactoylglutathione lyase family enzyme
MERGRFFGFDHVDARVRDLAAARALYDVLMPALGLTEVVVDEGEVEYYHPPPMVNGPRPFFGLHEDPTHVANETCLAFTAATPGDVDRLAQIALAAGALEMEGPEIPYSSERYYAVFFRDPSRNRIEICYRRAHEDRGEALALGT